MGSSCLCGRLVLQDCKHPEIGTPKLTATIRLQTNPEWERGPLPLNWPEEYSTDVMVLQNAPCTSCKLDPVTRLTPSTDLPRSLREPLWAAMTPCMDVTQLSYTSKRNPHGADVAFTITGKSMATTFGVMVAHMNSRSPRFNEQVLLLLDVLGPCIGQVPFLGPCLGRC